MGVSHDPDPRSIQHGPHSIEAALPAMPWQDMTSTAQDTNYVECYTSQATKNDFPDLMPIRYSIGTQKKHKAANSKVKFGPSSQFCVQFDRNVIWCKQGPIHLLIVQGYWSALVPCVNLCHFRRRQRACWTRGTATGGRLQSYLVGDNLLLENTRVLCIVKLEAQWREVCWSPIWGNLLPQQFQLRTFKIHVETTLLTLGLRVCGLTVVGFCLY